MRLCIGLSIGLMLLTNGTSRADDLPIAAVVRLEKKVDDLEKRVSELEKKTRTTNEAVFGNPLKSPTFAAITLRQPYGHTHTCPNCGDTWDHSKNSTHICQQCGTAQYVQDSTPRMVQVRSGTVVQTVPLAAQTPAVVQSSYSVSGCANGQCQATDGIRQRRGLFGWR